MRCYSSTSLNYLSKHCPRALLYHMEGAPCDRSGFDVGVAAHAVLEVCGKRGARKPDEIAAVATAVAEELIAKGRSYFGEKEPPMNPERAVAGRDLALQYLSDHELPDGSYEGCLYMGVDGEPCGPDEARYRALIDFIGDAERGDEEYSGLCVLVGDYKSSWQADDDELDTLQRRGQLVLAWLHSRTRPEVAGLVAEVWNLRTGRTHAKEMWLDEENVDQLGRWRDDILMLCRVADKLLDDGAPPAPGMGCYGCPWAQRCESALPWAAESLEDRAALYLALDAHRAELAKALKIELADRDPIAVNGGTLGFQLKSQQKPTTEAAHHLVRNWLERVGEVYDTAEVVELAHPAFISLLLALGMTKTAIENCAKDLWPGRQMAAIRREFLDSVLQDEQVVKFEGKKS